MAAQPLLLSLEEFHKRYDGAKPAYEYWFGRAVQKSTPTLLRGVVEVRLKVSTDAEPVPDAIAVRGKFKGVYPTLAPALCVEILSPGDTLPKAFEKANRYILLGTECVWIIDPEKRTGWTLSREGAPEPSWISPTGILRIGETAIGLPDLFTEVERNLDFGQDGD